MSLWDSCACHAFGVLPLCLKKNQTVKRIGISNRQLPTSSQSDNFGSSHGKSAMYDNQQLLAPVARVAEVEGADRIPTG